MLSKRARSEEKIVLEAPAYSGLIAAFDYLENCNRRIFNHGWVNFPLAYTQASQFYIPTVIQYFTFAGVFNIKTWTDEMKSMYILKWDLTFQYLIIKTIWSFAIIFIQGLRLTANIFESGSRLTPWKCSDKSQLITSHKLGYFYA